MRDRHNGILKMAFAVIASFALQGCSMFSSAPDAPAQAQAEDPDFHSVVESIKDPLAVPVEIADDVTENQINESRRPLVRKSHAAKAAAAADAEGEDDQAAGRKVASVASDDEESGAEACVPPKKNHRKRQNTKHPHHKGGAEEYTVKHGDTLMKIAFEKYGSLYRWREIYDDNKGKIGNFNALVAGTVLTIRGVE